MMAPALEVVADARNGRDAAEVLQDVPFAP